MCEAEAARDRRDIFVRSGAGKTPLLLWGSVAFVIPFARITSRVMHAIIDGGPVTCWIVVGPLEELTRLLPLLAVRLVYSASPTRWS